VRYAAASGRKAVGPGIEPAEGMDGGIVGKKPS